MKKLIILFSILISTPSLAINTLPLSKIASESYWLQLGHYQSTVLGHWESEIDGDDFFISPDGKTDPEAELKATIEAFNGKGLTDEEHKIITCKFPARFTWLKSKISNNWEALDCLALDEWKTVIDPAGVTLVFPTAFMNNPSSMFGHTLLRIDAKDQTRNKELVAFAINFAAEPDTDDNAALYAFKGLVGSYPGRFSLMPYYRKVREYNDLESRDIWEYKLNLNEQEVENILLHLWELQSAYFDYYFIDENCSYQLLSLLQLANEEIDLTSSFNLHAIPADTVAVLRDKNLLQEPNYRAAFGTKLFHYSEQLSDDDLALARKMMMGEPVDISQRSDVEQAAILEVAYEWLNFNYYNKGLDRNVTAPRSTKLLIARSRLKVSSPFSAPKKPHISPELGHASSRIGLSTQFSNEYNNIYSLSYRFAYHDLLDKAGGYIPGAKISFFDIQGSIDDEGHSRLEELLLIDAMAIPVDNRIFDSWSWNISLGFDRQPDLSKQSGRWFGKGGYGKSIGNSESIQAYLLGSLEANAGDITNNNIKLGIGSEFGVIWKINSDNNVMLSGDVMYLADADVNHHYNVELDWNMSLSRNWALRSKLGHQKWANEDSNVNISLFHYF